MEVILALVVPRTTKAHRRRPRATARRAISTWRRRLGRLSQVAQSSLNISFLKNITAGEPQVPLHEQSAWL